MNKADLPQVLETSHILDATSRASRLFAGAPLPSPDTIPSVRASDNGQWPDSGQVRAFGYEIGHLYPCQDLQ